MGRVEIALCVALLAGCGGPERISLDAGPREAGAPDGGMDSGMPDAGANDAGASDAGAYDAGPFDAGPVAMCPEPGVAQPDVPFLDQPAGAFTDPPDCADCPAEVTFERLVTTPGGTIATFEIGLAADDPATACTAAVVSDCGRAVFDVPWGEFGRLARTVPLFCGQNRIIVVCENAAGRSVRISDPIAAQPCSAGSLRVTLTWDDCGTDHELHIIRNGSHIYDAANDCTWNDCTYGGLDWPPLGAPAGDAAKDIDDTGASGIENGRVTEAEAGIYHVMVEMWGSVVAGCSTTQSNIDVFVDDVPVASLTQPLTLHQVWYVGAIDMPSGTFTAPTDLGARTTTAPVTDCTAAWGLTGGALLGCTLPIPDAL